MGWELVIRLHLALTVIAGALITAGDWAGRHQRVAARSGPFGGTVTSLAVDPKDPRYVYAAVGRWLYRSSDGAKSWHAQTAACLLPAGVRAIVIDPNTPTTLYAVTLARCLQEPGPGSSWASISDDGADALIVDPQRPTTLYAANFRGFFTSRDGGMTWEQLSSAPDRVSALAIDRRSPPTLYAGTCLRRRIQVARRRAAVAEGSAGSRCGRRAGLDDVGSRDRPGAARCSVRGTDQGGLFKSTDGAVRWRRVLDARAEELTIDPRHSDDCVCGRRVLWWASSPLPVEDHERRPHLGRASAPVSGSR